MQFFHWYVVFIKSCDSLARAWFLARASRFKIPTPPRPRKSIGKEILRSWHNKAQKWWSKGVLYSKLRSPTTHEQRNRKYANRNWLPLVCSTLAPWLKLLTQPHYHFHVSSLNSYKNLLLDQDHNFYLIILSILITYWIMYGYDKEKVQVNYF